ncbi:hypothetical protein [Prosthecobacter sp.]|uniref:hypothetical protein n=1 Tax=Prosthecobacter sp. TaxID=1965333 RepID=UPI0037845B13
MKKSLCLLALLLVACGKEEPKAEPKAVSPAAEVSPKPVVPEKKLPVAPQGELERMDPEKAKYIAIPNTPKDPEGKKVEKPATKPNATTPEEKKAPAPAAETKKAEVPAAEVKKAAAPGAETDKAAEPAPEVKKAAPAAQQ